MGTTTITTATFTHTTIIFKPIFHFVPEFELPIITTQQANVTRTYTICRISNHKQLLASSFSVGCLLLMLRLFRFVLVGIYAPLFRRTQQN